MSSVITSAAAAFLMILAAACVYMELDPDDPVRSPTRWKVVALLGCVLALLLAALCVEVPKAFATL